LSRQRPVFMHRDFQSRNILVREGKLRLIDFQTAHRGTGLYDAASLLRDPYHPLPSERSHLLAGELHGRLRDEGALPGIGPDEFREGFVLAGIQRDLQALAAFVKLGTVKGKKEFLDSIPAGLDLLEAGIDESGRFPSMKRMVAAVRERLEKGT
ncbi:MAG TPA: aminoglycoside phosphotransferase, partial [Candidatus Eisenbacteria bacterium]|nr:aminoglycoside phosphotransferase [Candidatus Eisenbacteria bacterium]